MRSPHQLGPRICGAVAALCPAVHPAAAQSIWADGFESGRVCPWSATVTAETCDGRDNDCDGLIDEGCSGGNPGNGGNGGGIYMDGVDQSFAVCGSVVSGNPANALGGGVFRVSNNGVGPMTIDRTTVAGNVVNPADNGGLTETVLPGPASPVLGTATNCPPTDQRGRPRNPSSCTPGAVEP